MNTDARSPLPTSKDVARVAGVSQATVSRVLSNHAVNPETRERVLKAMEKIGYRPNLAARAMRTSQLGIVGVVVARLSNPLYPELLQHLGSALRAAGQQMVVWHSESGGEEAALNAASQGLVDGVIFAAATAASVRCIVGMARLVPVVLVHRGIESLDVDQIEVDNFDGGRLVAEYFLRAGRQRPAIIAGDRTINTVRSREDGFLAAMQNAGRASHPRVRVSFASYEEGFRVARELVSESSCDAIFCVNDVIALGCMDGLRSHGLRIPEDVWVVGYDDVAMSRWSSFDLTTIAQPLQKMAELATSTLLGRLANATQEAAPAHIVLPSVLVVRGSTANHAWPDPTQLSERAEKSEQTTLSNS
ncbi:LacI family DNA-binding transcriptional regulator [Paraburkholderia sabiae]|uniref:LacI family DNA-binding transcriptional regulator n=1 Tax=Paraburkholderia sabiae TaxID=273251 RepID=A0ABU9QHV8_9BURK|nr:LacI family DNA-binding transcriptional regulator [Paraburkholderia sabiae]WJZ77415.1 LacI family DNA-binding transcriptional regulator [Paraburkholderia sabiae]CAD6557728.1 HTH-type transcriptional regulator DegA [Paraburkholderia sabiae]